MCTKEKFNIAEGLKNFDPASSVDPRIVKDFIKDLPYSQDEWDQYHATKDTFRHEEEWRKNRSEKHRKMAKDYAIAIEKAEEIFS